MTCAVFPSYSKNNLNDMAEKRILEKDFYEQYSFEEQQAMAVLVLNCKNAYK